MIDKPVQGAVDKATDNGAFEFAARAGFAVSGVLHLLVAYIILRIAFGSGGSADQSGALATLAGQTGGAVMLWTAAVGLLALALWRLAETVRRPPSGRTVSRRPGRLAAVEAIQGPGSGHPLPRPRVLRRAVCDG